MTTDIPLSDPKKSARTGITVDPRQHLDGFNDDRMVAEFNVEEQALYLFLRDDDQDKFAVLKEKNALRNEWEIVEIHENTNLDGRVYVTPENNLLARSIHEEGIHRSEDWGETWTEVLSGANPLYFRHLADAHGDIFLGNYEYGEGQVYKSTDDGETWTQIADLDITNDEHNHHTLPAQRGDILCHFNAHDGRHEMIVTDKDGNNPERIEYLKRAGNYQPMFGLEVTHQRNDQIRLMVFSDSNTYSTAYMNIGYENGGVTHHEVMYARDRAGHPRDASNFHLDAQYVDGGIAALTQDGRIEYTKDKWTWDSVNIEMPTWSAPTTSGSMAQGSRHLYVPYQKLTIVPKETITSLEPKTLNAKWVDRDYTQSSSSVMCGDKIPAHLFDEIQFYGYSNLDDTVRLQVQARPSVGGGPGYWENIIEWDGTEADDEEKMKTVKYDVEYPYIHGMRMIPLSEYAPEDPIAGATFIKH